MKMNNARDNRRKKHAKFVYLVMVVMLILTAAPMRGIVVNAMPGYYPLPGNIETMTNWDYYANGGKLPLPVSGVQTPEDFIFMVTTNIHDFPQPTAGQNLDEWAEFMYNQIYGEPPPEGWSSQLKPEYNSAGNLIWAPQLWSGVIYPNWLSPLPEWMNLFPANVGSDEFKSWFKSWWQSYYNH